MTYSPLDREGAFLTFISADADRASEAADIAMSEFRKFAESGPTEAELQAAKNKIATGATAKGEQPMGRLTAVGFEWVYMKQYVPLPDDIARLLRVSAEEVVEVARSFELPRATMLGLGPLESL